MKIKCNKCQKECEVNLGRGRPPKEWYCDYCRVAEANEISLRLKHTEIMGLRERVSELERELEKYKPFATVVDENGETRQGIMLLDIEPTYLGVSLWEFIRSIPMGKGLEMTVEQFLEEKLKIKRM